jgi:hypothetical protein
MSRVRRAIPAGLAFLAALGLGAFVAALALGDARSAWGAFLVNLLFWLGIAQGGVVVSASLYLTQARWGGASAYRLAEAFAGFLPLGWLLFWVLVPGRETVFSWIDHPLPAKAAWLNAPFLFERDGVGLLLMTVLSLWFVHRSRRADVVSWAESPGSIEMPPAGIRRMAPVLILVYALTYSILAFDLVMSLSPVWYSTLFGAYFFAGAYWTGLAAMGLCASAGLRPVPRDGAADPARGLHDLGKLVFAFSIFWAYLMWSQYLPIWYADIPEEAFFVALRVRYLPWWPLAWTALVLVWAVPFVGLLGRRPKRTPAILGPICAAGLAGMWLERYVLVTPSLSPRAVPLGWVAPLVTLGFAGAFGLCALPGLRRVPAAARGDA